MSQPTPNIVSDVAETIRTNYVGFASFTVLVWDHIDTFADEVEYIWKGKKGPIVYLFFLNRYFTPFGFIINLFAYLSPWWTFERCARFIRYEGCTVAIAVEIVGLMMSLRIKALYPHQPWITYTLWFLLAVETGLNAWLISGGRPVPHNPESGVRACSMIFDPMFSAAASSSAWFPLMYDSIVLALTLYRTLPSVKRREAGYIIRRLLEDGLLYYSVIFSVTLVLTIMIIAAPPGIKNINAQLEQLITVAMMSRITLNLKKAGRHAEMEVIAGSNWLKVRRQQYETWTCNEEEHTRSFITSSRESPPSVSLHKSGSNESDSTQISTWKSALRRSSSDPRGPGTRVPPALSYPPSTARLPGKRSNRKDDLAGLRFLTPTQSMQSRASFTPPATPPVAPAVQTETFEMQAMPSQPIPSSPPPTVTRRPSQGPSINPRNVYKPPDDW